MSPGIGDFVKDQTYFYSGRSFRERLIRYTTGFSFYSVEETVEGIFTTNNRSTRIFSD